MALLTDALDRPDVDITAEVAALTAQARCVIDSYLGLTINISGDPAVTLTVFADGLRTFDIRASVRIPLPDRGTDGVHIELILYARQPGAFVDLAADLAWLTGLESTDFALGQHPYLPVPTERNETLLASSVINQAIGVLIGRGVTPAEASRELDSHSASAAITRFAAASRILAGLPHTDVEGA